MLCLMGIKKSSLCFLFQLQLVGSDCSCRLQELSNRSADDSKPVTVHWHQSWSSQISGYNRWCQKQHRRLVLAAKIHLATGQGSVAKLISNWGQKTTALLRDLQILHQPAMHVSSKTKYWRIHSPEAHTVPKDQSIIFCLPPRATVLTQYERELLSTPWWYFSCVEVKDSISFQSIWTKATGASLTKGDTFLMKTECKRPLLGAIAHLLRSVILYLHLSLKSF